MAAKNAPRTQVDMKGGADAILEEVNPPVCEKERKGGICLERRCLLK